jgi:beta-glucosidase
MSASSTARAAPFVWGVSTSSYQIEGGVDLDGRGPSIWDGYCRVPGRIGNDDTGDVACDHYRRWPEDVALMKDLGVGAYRFSVAWPRVLPDGKGPLNPKGLAFYDRLTDALLEAGIEPWVCLYHWDLPQGLQETGGWIARDTAGRFADYATVVARRLSDRVTRFATFNESGVFLIFGFLLGGQAPGIRDLTAYHAAIHHVNLAHGLGVDAIRAQAPRALIGDIHNIQPVLPETPGRPEDEAAAATFGAYWNAACPDPRFLGHYPAVVHAGVERFVRPGDMAAICRPVDWLGINHYSPIYAKGDAAAPLGFAWGAAPADAPKSGIGWPIFPDAFRTTLLDAHRRYGLPIYVTENGMGHDDVLADGACRDPYRSEYLGLYVDAMGRAVAEGADVRGYFVWSLLDNFEWGAGYANRFGLVYMDYPTGTRVPKDSFRWFADRIRRGWSGR